MERGTLADCIAEALENGAAFIVVNPNTYDNRRDEIDAARGDLPVYQSLRFPHGIVGVADELMIAAIAIETGSKWPETMPRMGGHPWVFGTS